MNKKKFVLNKETVRQLSVSEMSQAMGAGTKNTDASCEAATQSPCDDKCIHCGDANKTSS